MSRTLFSIACVALVIAPHAFAVRDKAAAAPAKEAVPKEEVPTVVPPYVLKNQSKFNAPPETARVPFWPVGWSKVKQATVAVAAAAEVKMSLDANSFHVTSILISSGTTPSLAVINGRAYGEGEFLRSTAKGVIGRSRVRVSRIDDGTVTLEYENQKVVAPLRRPELNQHKEDGELLAPDR